MSADHDHADRDPYIQASIQALACAVAHIRGGATAQDIQNEMAAKEAETDA